MYLRLLMQALGAVSLIVQLWGRAWGFDSMFGLRDEKGWWLWYVRGGLLI